MTKIAGLILAGGQGARMKSCTPKGLHKINNKPMIVYIIDAFKQAGIEDICLTLSLKSYQQFLPLCENAYIQEEQLGTADAVASAAKFFNHPTPHYSSSIPIKGASTSSEFTIISPCDTPNINPKVLKDFYEECFRYNAPLGVIGVNHPNPYGYGRMVTDENNSLLRIIEEKDTDDESKKIKLCNTCIVFANTPILFKLLNSLNSENAQKEYLLGDIFEHGRQLGYPTHIYRTDNYEDFLGVNTEEQLENLEKIMENKNETISN